MTWGGDKLYMKQKSVGKRKQEHLVPKKFDQHGPSRWNPSTSLPALTKGRRGEWIHPLGLSALSVVRLKNHEINNWETVTCRPNWLGHGAAASASHKTWCLVAYAQRVSAWIQFTQTRHAKQLHQCGKANLDENAIVCHRVYWSQTNQLLHLFCVCQAFMVSISLTSYCPSYPFGRVNIQ